MLSLRKKITIIAVAFIALAVIMAAVFACGSSSDNKGTGGKPKDPLTCTVTFDLVGGTINGNKSYKVTIDKNSTVARPSEIPQRDGYVFWGWNTTGDAYDTMWQFDVEKITKDMTIFATWKPECTVTFHAAGGTFEDGTGTYTFTIVYGDKLTAPKVTPPEETMELVYWATQSGDRWDFSEPTIGNFGIELYAQWDIKKDLQRALAPFEYTKPTSGYVIYRVKDTSIAGELTVPNIVAGIGTGAFSGCGNLTSVVIPDTVKTVGSDAFRDCEKLKSVTLPSGLTSIKKSTFDGCTSLEQIRLPDTVTEIDEYAFSGCTALKSIEIPSGVTEIKNDVFKDCTSLRQVKLGDNVTKIDSRAFSGCTALADIQIPAALEQLGSFAFDGCLSLKSVTIPAACKEIGGLAFEYCTALTHAELHCETVGISAFSGCTALTNVTIGDEVRTIEAAAFMSCTALTEIAVPDGVTKLEAAFSNCSNLRTVSIGNGVDVINSNTFRNCYNLRSVSIGGGVKEIKFNAFSYCMSLLSITIPSSVETIDSNAFGGCMRLMEVYNLSSASYSRSDILPVHTDASEESVIYRTEDGFSFCTIEYRNTNPSVQVPYLVDYWGTAEDIVLPDSYNGDGYELYDYAFAYNPRLKSVKFSAGVKDIGSDILLGSDNVTSLTVDSGNTVYTSAGNCVISTAGKKFVLGCKTSVLPTDGSVTSIGRHVFCSNATITEFSIPDSVTSIDYYAFYGCTGITRTVGHVKYVDKWAIGLESYSGEEKLNLQLESGTVGITNRAFESRNSIGSVKFNPELKYVGEDAFYYCTNLVEVVMNDGLLKIGDMAFVGCSGLKEVVVPDSVTRMDVRAFLDCSNLKYVKLSSGLTNIGGRTFKDCTALEGVVIPLSVEYFAYEVFLGCPETVKIYYEGSEEQWNEIYISTIDNTELNNATKYFYSETEIEGVNCWHYGDDGKPTTVYN